MTGDEALLEFLVRLGDDHLVLGHRVSEWCGHAPMLEEDLSLPNIALDHIGQARSLFTLAGEIEGRGRDEDSFAYLRTEGEYHNLLLVERPNGDFAHTMMRQLFHSVFMHQWWQQMLSSSHPGLAAIAGKAVKESAYHVRHSAEWVIRLGDGTAESARRAGEAVEALTPYVDEMFADDAVFDEISSKGIAPLPSTLRQGWDREIGGILKMAKLEMPVDVWPLSGGRNGRHGEEMGFLLADLQYMQRTYPGMVW